MSNLDRPKKRIGLWLGLFAVLGVLLAARYGYLKIEALNADLRSLEAQVETERLTSRLGAAALAASDGDHERARVLASSYFAGLQSIADGGYQLDAAQRAILARRDDVITALSRAEAGTEETLARMFVRLQAPLETELDPSRPRFDDEGHAGEAVPEPATPHTPADTTSSSGTTGVRPPPRP